MMARSEQTHVGAQPVPPLALAMTRFRTSANPIRHNMTEATAPDSLTFPRRRSPFRGANGPRVLAMLATIMLAGGVSAARAVQEYPSNPTHRGVVDVDVYQVFPENRAGNGVYYQGRLMVSLPPETIRHVMPLPKPGRFAYLAVDAEGKGRIGLLLQPQDKQIRLNAVGNGFYHAIMTIDGVVYKKLYRMVEGRTVVDLLSSSKTADGPTPGERGLAFYHVSAALESDPTAGNLEKQFGMQIHVALYDEEQVRHYEFPVYNRLPQLTLSWTDPEHITYRLDDGRSEILSLSQFQ